MIFLCHFASSLIYSESGEGYRVGTGKDKEGNAIDSTDAKIIRISPLYNQKQVTEIGLSAFKNSHIEAVYIPKTIVLIKQFSFFNCQNLELIEFENGCSLQSIESYSINALPKIRNIDINGNSLKYIENNNFCDMHLLDKLIYHGNISDIKISGHNILQNTGSLSIYSCDGEPFADYNTTILPETECPVNICLPHKLSTKRTSQLLPVFLLIDRMILREKKITVYF